jgi:hypothetical protein
MSCTHPPCSSPQIPDGPPSTDLVPGALVQRVVDGDHALDGILGGFFIALPAHGVVHLLRVGTTPILNSPLKSQLHHCFSSSDCPGPRPGAPCPPSYAAATSTPKGFMPWPLRGSMHVCRRLVDYHRAGTIHGNCRQWHGARLALRRK